MKEMNDRYGCREWERGSGAAKRRSEYIYKVFSRAKKLLDHHLSAGQPLFYHPPNSESAMLKCMRKPHKQSHITFLFQI